jgi:hypothetical protein
MLTMLMPYLIMIFHRMMNIMFTNRKNGSCRKIRNRFFFCSWKEVYKLKDIQRYCKTKIFAKPVPTLDDIKNTRINMLFNDISSVVEEMIFLKC